MKEFLKKSVIYFSIILLFCFLMVCIQYRTSINNYINKINETKAKTFLFSDSRGHKINTNSLGICNLSMPSDSYIDIKRKIKFLINNKTEVSNIILSYDEHLFSKYRNNRNNNYKSIWLKRLSLSDIYSILFEYRRNYTFDLTRQIFTNTNKKKSEETTTIIKNNFFDILTEHEIKKLTELRLDYQFTGFSEKQNKTFNEIIELCKNNNIQITLIKFPLTKVYINERKKSKVYKNFKISKVKPLNIIDLSKSIIELKLFKNVDHLNSEGKQKFIKLLKKEIQKLNTSNIPKP
jgi:hypothetical protein